MSAFPLVEDPSFAAAANLTGAQKRRTLLIVDDERAVRDSLWFIFKDQYQLLLASGGAEAIRLASENRIDAAVVDIRMVGLSGIQTFAELKKIDAAIQVVILTAYETLESAREALRLGASDYLGKPYDLNVIREAVAHAMERRAIADQIRDQEARLRECRQEIHNQQLREELARSRTEIYASVLHDINGPLTIISGFVELVHEELARAEKLEGPDLEAIRTHVSSVRRQVNVCLEIARRYLGFLRGASTGSECTVGVNQVLRDVSELLRRHPAAKAHRLTISAASPDVLARINGTDLLQVLLNLTINAFQSSEQPHQVWLEVEPLDRAPEVRPGPHDYWLNPEVLSQHSAWLELRVKDNGDGIPEESLPRIFDFYFTTKRENEGTGLGLSIVRRLVTDARGAIYVRSAVGQGAIFTIYLPA